MFIFLETNVILKEEIMAAITFLIWHLLKIKRQNWEKIYITYMEVFHKNLATSIYKFLKILCSHGRVCQGTVTCFQGSFLRSLMPTNLYLYTVFALGTWFMDSSPEMQKLTSCCLGYSELSSRLNYSQSKSLADAESSGQVIDCPRMQKGQGPKHCLLPSGWVNSFNILILFLLK